MSSGLTKKQVGNLGEDIACRFLSKKGFLIWKRNYWKKWGEIDIVAQKKGKTHFVEVKSVTVKDIELLSKQKDIHRPEDNVHPWKLKRLSRTIQTFLLEEFKEDVEWQFDVLVVFLDVVGKRARVRYLEDIVLS